MHNTTHKKSNANEQMLNLFFRHDIDALSEDNDSPYEEPPTSEKEIFSLFRRHKVVSISDTALTYVILDW